jgi:hypothetical protein
MNNNGYGCAAWCVTVGLPTGPVCGGGILLDLRHVLTPAHVVPGGRLAPQGVVVGFPTLDDEARPARVVRWVPPTENAGNIAILELGTPAPRLARPAQIARGGPAIGHELRLRQYDADGDRLWETPARAVGRNEGSAQRQRLESLGKANGGRRISLCGAGVVDPATDGVLGMVVTEDRFGPITMVWMVDFATVARYWPTPAQLAVPVNGQPPATTAHTRSWLILKLAGAITELPTMNSPTARDQVVNTLPRHIANAIPRHAEGRFDVLAIVRTCDYYPEGLAELVNLLMTLEGSSAGMDRVLLIMSELRG